jgi:hypothetical protein
MKSRICVKFNPASRNNIIRSFLDINGPKVVNMGGVAKP